MNQSTKELFKDFELRVLLAIDAIESGKHEGDWIHITLPGTPVVKYKVVPSVERLHLLLDKCRKEQIFAPHNHNRGRPRGPRSMPKFTLKEFIANG